MYTSSGAVRWLGRQVRREGRDETVANSLGFRRLQRERFLHELCSEQVPYHFTYWPHPTGKPALRIRGGLSWIRLQPYPSARKAKRLLFNMEGYLAGRQYDKSLDQLLDKELKDIRLHLWTVKQYSNVQSLIWRFYSFDQRPSHS